MNSNSGRKKFKRKSNYYLLYIYIFYNLPIAMNRELKNLQDWWEVSTKKNENKKKEVKRRGRPRLKKHKNINNDDANINSNINNISPRNNNNINNFKSPLPIARKTANITNKITPKNFHLFFKLYTFNNNDNDDEDDLMHRYYSLTEVLLFLKVFFNIDYENYILKVI
jgi:hypothetical protein